MKTWEGEKMRKYAEKWELHICQPGPLWLRQHSSWCAACLWLLSEHFSQVCASYGFTLMPAFLSSPALCLWRCWWSWGPPRCCRWWSHTACSRRIGRCCCWPAGSPCSPASLTSEAGKVRETDWSHTCPKQFQKDASFFFFYNGHTMFSIFKATFCKYKEHFKHKLSCIYSRTHSPQKSNIILYQNLRQCFLWF